MKRIFAIFISLGLLYGGIAWAVEDCLRRVHHPADHDHHRTAEFQSEAPTDDHGRENRTPTPQIHCADLMALLGPIARVSASSQSGFFSKPYQLSHQVGVLSSAGCEIRGALATSANDTANPSLLAGVPAYLSISVLII